MSLRESTFNRARTFRKGQQPEPV